MSKELAQSNKKLVVGINRTWDSALSDSKSAMNKSILTGEMLAELKLKTTHGEWKNRFKSSSNTTSNVVFDFNFSIDHASKLMRIAANKDLFKITSNGEILTISEMSEIILTATPEQLAQVEQLKKEEADRIALAEANKALAEAKAAIDNAKKQDDVIDGVFVEVKKPAPVVEIEPEFDEIEELRDLLDEQHSANKALQDDNDSMLKTFESNEPLTIALEELKKSNAMNRILNERINGLMNEKNEAIRNAKMWKGQFERLEKKLKAA